MDHRLYFVLGDLFACLITGGLVGWLCWLIVNPSWNMWIAMFLMMAVCMFASLLIWLPFSVLFGAMEVMIPVMQTGMLSGMVVGMWKAMSILSVAGAAVLGAVIGLLVLILVWIANAALRGVVAVGEDRA